MQQQLNITGVPSVYQYVNTRCQYLAFYQLDTIKASPIQYNAIHLSNITN